ncbi:hypothetical protein LAZ67_17002449 [Cordylochernes scorpioides]|uniref:CCHC-type domain-containing protein n=1 Tax=Cordylochernes scorpioides TaxID=51811 RepID=A0ABY6LDY9_9ARAC|nr:hypothetical protein LAZ67_17002449 [Cordylochernes scorpioides]
MEQKLKQRICIEFCVKLQISATETFEMLNKAFPNDAPKRTTVFEWHSRFKAGRISIEEDPRQGRPKFQRTDENVQKITDLIKENPRTTLLELEQDTGISKTTIGRIVTEDLKLKKIPAKFIPRFLTNEQKLCRLATCEDMMEMTRTDPEWKYKIITGDETWVYGYDPESKPQSAEWRVDDQLYSDHHPLVLTIKGQNFNEKKTKREDYNITRYRWSADGLAMFKMKLEELREKNIPASDDLVYTFNQRILEAMSSAKITYSIKGGPRKSKPWFDKDCYDMKKLAKESLKKYRKTNRLEDRECYASSRKKYLALLDLKRKGFDNEKQEILRNAKDSKTFWKTIALYKSTSIIQGEISIQDWLNFYRELMTTEKNLRICNLHNVISQNDPILDSEITNADIYKEIAGLRSNKACGPDGIPNEVLKTLPDSYILLLKQLYNSVMTTGKYPAIWTNSTIHPIFKNGYKNSPSNYRAKVRKCDLSKLAYELGEVVPPESRIVDLKHLILNSQSYEEEFAKQLLETLIEDRERIEERERIEDRKRIEDRERIERERKEQMVMEFELEKLRIQTTRGNNDTSRSTSNDAHYEIRKLMPKYESKDNDLSFYLILFERQAKRLGLDEDQWAFSLLGLLPYEMTQLIARETEEQSGDYRFVKRLLLKRYKLSPEQFRQKFEKHERSQKGSWRDFAFELRGYFNEWIEGMNVENFDALKDLSVTNQLKKKVPNVLRNHLIDDWTKLNNPDELADKLDEYENVRTEMGPPHWNAKHLIPPSFQQKSARFPNQSEVKETKQGTNVSGQDAARNEISETYPNTLRRMVNRTIRNDKGEPKCFNCNQFGHIARDCPAPRTTLTCRGCGQTGHKERNCTRPKEGLKVANLEVEGLETVPPDVYLKDVKIDNKETVKAMIDTGSSSCLMRESVARRISVDIEPDSTSLYGIGNQTAPAARTVGKTTVDLEIDGIVGREITVFIVNDDAQPYDLLIGRTWTDLPYVSFARIGKNLHIGYSSEFPFANLQEEIKSRRIELRATETVQLESDSINFTSAITDEVKDGYVLFTGVDDACVDSLLEVVDGKTTVPIISAGKGKLRVRKNQCVGRVELLKLDDIVVNLDVAEDSFQTKNEEKREGQDQMKRKRPILPEDINVNHSLTSKERQEILDVVNEYRDCFALGMEELGCTDVTKMNIKEVDGSKPVCLRPYKTTASEREAIREIVREWKDNGIVTETRSPYASPVLLVRKKTGDHRLVVDYRRLNIQTAKDKFPLPRIDDLLEGLRNAKFFTTLDLAHGYLQIPLTDKD